MSGVVVIRGHGKYYEGSFISRQDLGSLKIYFYAPPGAALAGDLADDIIKDLNRNVSSSKDVCLEKRNYSEYSNLPANPKDSPEFLPHVFQDDSNSPYKPLSADPLQNGYCLNYTVSGDQSLDTGTLKCGIYVDGKLVKPLKDGEELSLAQVIAEAKRGLYGATMRELHWAACSSLSKTNIVFPTGKWTGYKVTYYRGSGNIVKLKY